MPRTVAGNASTTMATLGAAEAVRAAATESDRRPGPANGRDPLLVGGQIDGRLFRYIVLLQETSGNGPCSTGVTEQSTVDERPDPDTTRATREVLSAVRGANSQSHSCRRPRSRPRPGTQDGAATGIAGGRDE